MATNQRKNERVARKNAKNRKTRSVLCIIIIVVIAALAVMKLFEVDYSNLFSAVKGENSNSISSVVSDDGSFPYSLSFGLDTVLTSVGGKLAVLNDETYTVINSSNAQVQLAAEHGYANPVIKTSESYSVIIDQGAGSFRLDSASDNIYENTIAEDILCADVADTGVVAVASVSGIHKSTVTVYGKTLNQKLGYEVSGGYITAVAIDSNGKNVAFVVTGSENARLKSTLYIMSIGATEPSNEFVFEGSSVLDIHFSSKDLYVVGTDFVSVIDSFEKEIQVFEQGSINTVAFCYNTSDSLVLAYGEYAGSSANKLAFVKSNGKVKSQAEINSAVKAVAASGNSMTALTSSEVITFKNANAKEKSRIVVDDSYSSIIQMSSKVFAVHQSLLELIND